MRHEDSIAGTSSHQFQIGMQHGIEHLHWCCKLNIKHEVPNRKDFFKKKIYSTRLDHLLEPSRLFIAPRAHPWNNGSHLHRPSLPSPGLLLVLCSRPLHAPLTSGLAHATILFIRFHHHFLSFSISIPGSPLPSSHRVIAVCWSSQLSPQHSIIPRRFLASAASRDCHGGRRYR